MSPSHGTREMTDLQIIPHNIQLTLGIQGGDTGRSFPKKNGLRPQVWKLLLEDHLYPRLVDSLRSIYVAETTEMYALTRKITCQIGIDILNLELKVHPVSNTPEISML